MEIVKNIMNFFQTKKSEYLPDIAINIAQQDRKGLSDNDPGVEKAIKLGMKWLCLAQDYSASQDGGVARHYSLINGWATSYPETTGYIVPTLLEFAQQNDDLEIRHRAKRMLDWLISIQFPEGGFQGGRIDAKPRLPVTFNTGQILLGLSIGVREFGNTYLGPMQRAADWLVDTMDVDGCWRNYPSPFTIIGERAYDTHVAWGLLEAARILPDKPYSETALRNVDWALTQQRENGWFENCCLNDPSKPLTHTLGYVLRGILEAFRFTKKEIYLSAARKTTHGILEAMRSDGFISGRLSSNWQGAVNWACLTGTAQIACCWLILYQLTGNQHYRDAAYIANHFVRRTLNGDGPREIQGAIKGSFPIDGDYGKFEYLNWACKFSIDTNMLEQKIRIEK